MGSVKGSLSWRERRLEGVEEASRNRALWRCRQIFDSLSNAELVELFCLDTGENPLVGVYGQRLWGRLSEAGLTEELIESAIGVVADEAEHRQRCHEVADYVLEHRLDALTEYRKRGTPS